MKKLFWGVICTIIITSAGYANATPVNIDIDAENSSAEFTSYQQGVKIFHWTFGGGSSLSVALASGLDDVNFTLNDGETSNWFNFLTFTSTGTGIGYFDLEAIMAFSSPLATSVTAEADGGWGAISGKLPLIGKYSISAGALYWDDNTLEFFDALGNEIVVTLEQGLTINGNSTVDLKAQITNNGGGVASVPEPTTMLLFGTGLIGCAGVMRRIK